MGHPILNFSRRYMIEIKPDPYFCGLVNKGVCREKKSFITLSSSRVLIYSHLYCITRVKKLFFSGRGTNLIWTSGPLIPPLGPNQYIPVCSPTSSFPLVVDRPGSSIPGLNRVRILWRFSIIFWGRLYCKTFGKLYERGLTVMNKLLNTSNSRKK